MAVDLMSRHHRRAFAAAALWITGGAWALGPNAPFTPPTVGAGPAVEAETAVADTRGLTGLRLRNHPMALIDGQWSRIGDSVRGARLAAIRADGATLRHADGRSERLPWNAPVGERADAPNPPAPKTAATTSVRTTP